MIGWLMNALAVAIGGSLGALCRYGLSLLCTHAPLSRFTDGISGVIGGGASFSTTIANLIGCLFLGVVYQWTETAAAGAATPLTPRMILALRVGFLGSLTTFSTLIGDAAVLSNEGRAAVSLTLMSVNLIGGWALFLVGIVSVRGMLS